MFAFQWVQTPYTIVASHECLCESWERWWQCQDVVVNIKSVRLGYRWDSRVIARGPFLVVVLRPQTILGWGDRYCSDDIVRCSERIECLWRSSSSLSFFLLVQMCVRLLQYSTATRSGTVERDSGSFKFAVSPSLYPMWGQARSQFCEGSWLVFVCRLHGGISVDVSGDDAATKGALCPKSHRRRKSINVITASSR